MEVHAHSHTARKKWTHYFWEFLMLFLAVFCGFLAEYKLEQTIERHREKEYMQLMVEDLKKDTANINTMVAGNRVLISGLDSLLNMQLRLLEAQEKERLALDELNAAIQQAKDMTQRAQSEQRNAESREKVIITFKNKEGKVLEITDLEQLSPEKLQELGFDVEILKRIDDGE